MKSFKTLALVGLTVLLSGGLIGTGIGVLTEQEEIKVSAASEKTIYLSPGPWDTDSPKYWAWCYGGSVDASWAVLEKCTIGTDENVYKATIDGTYTQCNFVRGNSSAASPSWDYKWNQTNDITLSNGNYTTVTGWGQSNFTQSNIYTVQFYDGTQKIDTREYKSGSSLTFPSVFKESMGFGGWYNSSDFTGDLCTTLTTVNSNFSCYVKFVKTDDYYYVFWQDTNLTDDLEFTHAYYWNSSNGCVPYEWPGIELKTDLIKFTNNNEDTKTNHEFEIIKYIKIENLIDPTHIIFNNNRTKQTADLELSGSKFYKGLDSDFYVDSTSAVDGCNFIIDYMTNYRIDNSICDLVNVENKTLNEKGIELLDKFNVLGEDAKNTVINALDLNAVDENGLPYESYKKIGETIDYLNTFLTSNNEANRLSLTSINSNDSLMIIVITSLLAVGFISVLIITFKRKKA